MDDNNQTSTIENYKGYRDTKIIGMIVLILSVSMLILSFLHIPGVSTLNKYTVGLLIGFYFPIFYVFWIYGALKLMFPGMFKNFKWLKISSNTFILLIILIITLSVSSGYYQTKDSWTIIGGHAGKSTAKGGNDFTSTNDPGLPKDVNGGLLGIVIYSFITMLVSGIGAFIVSLVMLVLLVSYFFTGTGLGLGSRMRKQKKVIDESKKAHFENKDKAIDIKNFEVLEKPSKKIEKEIDKEEKQIKKVEKKEGDLPFFDPFE